MRNLSLIWLCFLCTFLASAQEVQLTGKVMDGKTGQPLPFANVFINGTSRGTTSDADGNYSLYLPALPSWELVCSYVGYVTSTVTRQADETGVLNFRLQPDARLLGEVSVKGTKDRAWESQLKRFLPVFLGLNPVAKNTKILNPWVLEFQETDGALTAEANAPLEIENQDLGYYVRYHLQKFRFTGTTYLIKGAAYFTPLQTDDPVIAARWTKNRYSAYKNSPRYVFAQLLAGSSEEIRFYTAAGTSTATIRDSRFAQESKKLKPYKPGTAWSPGSFPGTYKLRLPSFVEVHHTLTFAPVPAYADLSYAISWIEATQPAEITKSGQLLNPGAVNYAGHLSDQRIADLLPFDYEPAENQQVQKFTEPQFPREKTSLVTDKPYYYAGERIWLAAQVFPESGAPDSVSRVLYVELIDSLEQVVQREILAVEAGRSSGFLTTRTVLPGKYYLRAYTRWMLNFDLRDIAVIPLPILSNAEEAIPIAATGVITNWQLKLEINKKEFTRREAIEFKATLVDEDGNPVPGVFSFSAIDRSQVLHPVPAIPLDWPAFKDVQSRSLSKNQERGLTISGRIKPLPGKDQVHVSLLTRDLQEAINLPVSTDGKFTATGLIFYDTLTLAAQVQRGPRNKVSGQVIFDSPLDSLRTGLLRPYTLKRRISSQRRNVAMDTAAYTLLGDVVVKDTRLKAAREFSIYGRPDVVVEGSWLQKENYSNIITALQSRVSGLVLMSGMDDAGVVRTYVRFGAPFSTGSPKSMEPLLIIDGVPMIAPDGIIDALRVISPVMIDRIEVIKYGSGAVFGVRGGSGIISIYTTRPATNLARSRNLDPAFFTFQLFHGFQQPEAFPLPDYSNTQPGTPDYRTTLCWIPEVKSGDEVRFYTGDKGATYDLNFRGIIRGKVLNVTIPVVVR